MHMQGAQAEAADQEQHTDVSIPSAPPALVPTDGIGLEASQDYPNLNLHSRNIPFALLSEFDEVQEIGSGSYKRVYKAVWTRPVGEYRTNAGRGRSSDNNHASVNRRTQTVAICVPRNNSHISREVAVFEQLGSHEHLTHLLALTVNQQNLPSLVTEYAPRAGLDNVVMDCAERSVRVLDDVWVAVCTQVCLGMQHLERHGLIHRDLAARNVLVFDFDEGLPTWVLVKIADYGRTPHNSSE